MNQNPARKQRHAEAHMQRLADEADRMRHAEPPCQALPVVKDGEPDGLNRRPEFSILLRNKITGELSAEGGIELETYARWRSLRIEREGDCEVVALVVRWVEASS